MSKRFEVVIVGAGPAGLYAAILMKRLRPNAVVRVFERNPAHATFGFGVVFSDRALAFLGKDDPETAALIEPQMQSWSDIAIVHRGVRIDIDGIGFSAIGRLELLDLLRRRALRLDVTITYGQGLESVADAGHANLIIGADGVNSMVRAEAPDAFGEQVTCLGNRFVWYGATKAFPTLTQSFKTTGFGPFNAHHYRYAPDMSTFLVECGHGTFTAAGLDSMTEAESRAFCQSVFADELEGAKLIANNSNWRQFPLLRCERWFDGNRVLVGDALHTAHFSIGSGTRLALEDVMALVRALDETQFDVEAALPRYQAARQPILEKIIRAARASAQWYEHFEQHMSLDPWQFALSYIRRAGRLNADRLRALAPQFTRTLEAHQVDLTP